MKLKEGKNSSSKNSLDVHLLLISETVEFAGEVRTNFSIFKYARVNIHISGNLNPISIVYFEAFAMRLEESADSILFELCYYCN